MRSLGIVIEPGAGQPILLGAVVSGTRDDPALEEEFDLPAGGSDPSEQAVVLARLLHGKLPGLGISAGAIRIASPSRPQQNRMKGNAFRAHAEGAVLFVLREYLNHPVVIGDQPALAKHSGIEKDALVETAKGLSKRKFEAVVAAIAALPG
jgi:hypothetical protein